MCPLAYKKNTTNTQLNRVYSKHKERESEGMWTGKTDRQTNTHTDTPHTVINLCICDLDVYPCVYL